MLHHFICVHVVRIIGGLPIRLSCVLCQQVAQLLFAFSYPAPPSPEVYLSATGRQLEAVLTAIGLSHYCVPEEVTRTGQQHSSPVESVPPHATLTVCGVVWCGVVWCGVVWCGVVWCSGVYHWCQYACCFH